MNISKPLLPFLFLLFLFTRCNLNEEITLPLSESISIFSLDNFYVDNPLLNSAVDSIYILMTPVERYSQLVISSMGAGTNELEKVIDQTKEGSIGGVVFLGENRSLLKKSEQLQAISRWPMLLSLDAEPSLINRRVVDLEQSFNNTSEAKSVDEAVTVSMEIAEILHSLGIQQNYAPVSDLSANKSIINKRSYGNDVEDVISKTNAFIEEHQSNGIVATAKHFPGHGNAKGDSHKLLVSIKDVNEELNVFKSNIENGVISVMVGHIAIEEGMYATDGKPATLSRNVVTDLLRKELNFQGIIITDAMNMKAVSELEDADYRALLAGSDLVLMPKDPTSLIKRISEGAASSPAMQSQLEKSVKRVIRLKLCLGLYEEKHINIGKVEDPIVN